MDTLSNVYSREGGSLLSSARLIPRTTSSQDKPGVSVENAPLTAEDNCEQEQQKQWFVLRVAYHHEQVAKDWLTEVGIDSYLPMHYAEKEVAGKKKRVQEPLIPNLLFVQTTEERLNLALASPANAYLSYYYNHFRTNADGTNPPLAVPDKQMDNFIRLTSIDSDHILFVDRSQCHFRNGDHVVVTDGDFRGIEGRIARVARQQRVVVELDGIGCITTAYIPTAFLRVKKEDSFSKLIGRSI